MATHLIDKSAWVRLGHPLVDPKWTTAMLAGRLAITGIGMIEILMSARDSSSFAGDRTDLESMPRVALNETMIDAAIDIQAAMVALGTHRAPSPADLILAACAQKNGLTVLHYDKDFDLIAAATGQATEWLAEPGSLP